MTSDLATKALEVIHSAAIRHAPDILLMMCLGAAASLLLSIVTLIKCRNLSRELDALRRSTQKLISSEEKRILRELKRDTDHRS